MGLFDTHKGHHDEVYSGEHEHKGHLSHEVVAGAVGFEAFKAYEKKREKEGHHDKHALAKEVLAGLVAAEAEKLFETKGLKHIDAAKAKLDAKRHAEKMYEGVAPHDYEVGEKVDVHVNSLTPMMGPKMQLLKSIIPYDYYYKPFHFCEPEDKKDQPESLGSILFGDRIFNSPYELFMLKNDSCHVLCENQSKIPGEDASFINARIRENYAINWLIDGLPAASKRTDSKTNSVFYSIGFELGNQGTMSNLSPLLHNHYAIEIQYHQQDENKYRVVGVLVRPSSHKYESLDDAKKCHTTGTLTLDEKTDNAVWYTYKVDWTISPTAWATRWDNYLHTFDPRIHWFSLVNSIVIVLFLTGMVAMILLRALHKDISRYNQIEAQEDVQEDFGWKLVHGD
ncbi:1184_t:CDS:2, partial [Acaulospora morrowiae]